MGIFDRFKNILTNKNNEIAKDVSLYDKGLEKTRNEFTSKLSLLNSKYKRITQDYFDELEELLIMADIGVNTVMNFVDKLKKRVKKKLLLMRCLSSMLIMRLLSIR